MQITLTPEQAKFIAEAVASGHFATPEDVMEVVFTHFEEQEKWKAYVKATIAEGLEDQAAGRMVTSEDFLAKIQERRQKTA